MHPSPFYWFRSTCQYVGSAIHLPPMNANGNERTARVRRGAIGVLRRGPRYFMVQRAAGVPKGGFWCFPGGHVEAGETSRDAVKRELSEELGIEVETVERVGAVRILDTNHVLAVWIVKRIGGEFRPAASEIAEARWLTAEEIRRIPRSIPSNERVLEMLGE